MQVVRARLRDDVDEAGGGATELRIRAVGHHDDLLDRIQVEGERWPLAPSILAEEGIVEVGAVHRDVVLDSLLAVHNQLFAIGALNGRHTRRELREIQEIVLEVGQVVDRPLLDARRSLRSRHLDDGGVGGHLDLLLHGRNFQPQRESDRLPDFELQPVADEGREPRKGDGHAIRAQRQEKTAEPAILVSGQHLLVVGGGVSDRDGRAR